jgi:hypothetical protein
VQRASKAEASVRSAASMPLAALKNDMRSAHLDSAIVQVPTGPATGLLAACQMVGWWLASRGNAGVQA